MGHENIVALSGSSKETAAYAKSIGKRLRFITNKDTMRAAGHNVTEIHYLPGWDKRRDKHAIASVIDMLRRKRRKTPILEKHIVRLQDGSFVDQDYRGPELEAVADTQKAQIDGLRQMHAPDPGRFEQRGRDVEAEAEAIDDLQDAMEEHDADIVHLPQTIDAEEAAEEQGIDPSTEEFFDFLEKKD